VLSIVSVLSYKIYKRVILMMLRKGFIPSMQNHTRQCPIRFELIQVDETEKVQDSVAQMKSLVLSEPEQQIFAEFAIELLDAKHLPSPVQINRARR